MPMYSPAGESDFESDDDYSFDWCDTPTLYEDNDVSHIESHGTSQGYAYANSEGNKCNKPDNGQALLLNDLQNAIMIGNVEAVRHSVACLENVDVIMNSGWTPLMYAAYFAQLKIVTMLIQKGADPNLKNYEQATALHIACRSTTRGNMDKIIDVLISAGAVILDADKVGKTPLMYAASRGNMGSAIKKLFKYNSEDSHLNCIDIKNWNAIDWAAAHGQIENIKLLLHAGAKVSCNEHAYKSWDCKVTMFMKSQNINFCNENTVNDDKKLEENDSLQAFDSGDNDLQKSASYSEKVISLEEMVAMPVAIKQVDFKEEDYEMYGQLELFLLGLDLSSYIPLFKDQDITFEQLLCLTENDLKTIGISKLGVRKKILDAIRECHAKHTKTSFLPDMTTTVLTFEAMSNIMKGASDQVTYIASCVRYIQHHIETCPEVLQPNAENHDEVPIEGYQKKIQVMSGSVYKLSVAMKSIQKAVKNIERKTPKALLMPADLITGPRPIVLRRHRIVVGLSLACFFISFFYKAKACQFW